MIKVYIFTIKNFATILSLFQLILSIRDCYCPAVLKMGYIHSLGKKSHAYCLGLDCDGAACSTEVQGGVRHTLGPGMQG